MLEESHLPLHLTEVVLQGSLLQLKSIKVSVSLPETSPNQLCINWHTTSKRRAALLCAVIVEWFDSITSPFSHQFFYFYLSCMFNVKNHYKVVTENFQGNQMNTVTVLPLITKYKSYIIIHLYSYTVIYHTFMEASPTHPSTPQSIRSKKSMSQYTPVAIQLLKPTKDNPSM